MKLYGKKVLITREKSQAEALASLIERYEGVPLVVPLIKTECKKNESFAIDERSYEWIFFTSVNGVRCFMKQHRDADVLKRAKLAAVGDKTAKAIETYGYRVHFIPTMFNAESMVEQFLERYPNSDHFLIVRGNLSRDVLLKVFAEKKRTFDALVVYETKPNVAIKEQLIETLKQKKPDYLTFTSPSTVDTFVRLLEDTDLLNDMREVPAVSIGTTTEEAVRSHHFSTLITPKTFTIEQMVDALLKFENERLR